MNWDNVSLAVLGLSAFFSAFTVALWISLTIWTFRDMRARSRDAFAQLLAALMGLVLGPFGVALYFILRPRETLAEKYERSLEEEALLQDIEERQICPGCKQPIESDYMLCPICHARLRKPCIHCERLIHPRWSVCPYCAESQKAMPGIDRAGRVTLLDLQREEELSVAESQGQAEPVAVLEADAMRNLNQTAMDEAWDTEWSETEESGASPQLFPAADDEPGPAPSAPEGQEEADQDWLPVSRDALDLSPATSGVEQEDNGFEVFSTPEEALDLDPSAPEAEEEAEADAGAGQARKGMLSFFRRR